MAVGAAVPGLICRERSRRSHKPLSINRFFGAGLNDRIHGNFSSVFELEHDRKVLPFLQRFLQIHQDQVRTAGFQPNFSTLSLIHILALKNLE